MEVCHDRSFLQSPSVERLREFLVSQSESSEAGTADDFEGFERELHDHMMAIERDLVGQEMARYDVDVPEVVVEGVTYRRVLEGTETYLSAAGPVKVSRHLYRPAGRSSKSICPMELRVGIIGGLFTPRAARIGAFAMAQLSSREATALLSEIGGMQPSISTLDRLPKVLSVAWESHREAWEDALRAQETVPIETAIVAVSLDGVMVPMRDTDRREKRSQSDKQPQGPAGYREVGCGSVALYDQEVQRLETVRYGRMPERCKATLCSQLQAEVQSILAVQPDLTLVKLADGAETNWRFLSHLELGVDPSITVTEIEIVDFFHAAEHLKRACDAVWGKGKVQAKAEFERLRTLLKEADGGVDRVIGSLRYRAGRAKGARRKRILKELNYFRNQRERMHYASYLARGLPIGSGVVEATCKTLATQRMKRSGMAWRQEGGQAILTLRSLIQSDRWSRAWPLLSAAFRETVQIPHLSQIEPVPCAA